MPSDNELLAKFKRLAYENIEIIEEKATLEKIAASGSITDLNVQDARNCGARKAIISISKMLQGVRTKRDFDDEIAFLRQDICTRLEENEMSMSAIIIEMISSSNTVCQRVASAYTSSDGDITTALLEYVTAKAEILEDKAGVFPGTSGRTGRGRI